MKCDQVKEHIADYLAGALSPSEAEELDEHFAQCAACKQETAALSETWEMLGLLEQEQPSAQLRPRFYQSLEAYREGLESAAPTTSPAPVFRLGRGLGGFAGFPTGMVRGASHHRYSRGSRGRSLDGRTRPRAGRSG
jgi:anti-sigma factor RsiW